MSFDRDMKKNFSTLSTQRSCFHINLLYFRKNKELFPKKPTNKRADPRLLTSFIRRGTIKVPQNDEESLLFFFPLLFSVPTPLDDINEHTLAIFKDYTMSICPVCCW